jgi:hypothetical protein
MVVVDRVVTTLRNLLQQGLAPEQLALTVCLGVAVGTLPLIWGTTLLCLGVAARFRLNQPAMQGVNYLVYPLQIALFIPFFRLGAKLLPWGPSLSADLLKSMLHGHITAGFSVFCWSTAKAIGAWLVTVPPLMIVLYPLLLTILRRKKAVSK